MSTRLPAAATVPRWLIAALVCLAALAVIAPVTVAPMPYLWDVPNHLVRLWVLLGYDKGTPVAAMYQPDWSLASTNLGLDHLGMVLGQVLPFGVLGPALAAVSLLIVPAGVIVLNRALFGGPHVWHVGLFLLAWNFVVVGGLLSFQLGLGCALFAAALDTRLTGLSRWTRFAARAAMATGLMVVHVFGLMFFLLLLVGLDVGRRRPPFEQPIARRLIVRRLVYATAACVLPVVALALFAPRLPGAHVLPGAGAPFKATMLRFPDPTVLEHLSIMLTPLKTYDLVPDLLTVVAIMALPVYALLRGRLQMHFGLFWLAVVLFVLCHFVPSTLFGTGWIDKRLPAMAGLMWAASVRPQLPATVRGQVLVGCLLLGAVIARAAFIGTVWSGQQAAVRDLRAVSATIEPGSAVLVAEHFTGSVSDPRAPLGRYAHGEPIFRHLPTLLVIWRQAFVPTVFSAAGKQPLKVLPPWIELAVPEGGTPNLDELDAPEAIIDFHYLADWRRRFHYLLVINADLPHAGRQIGDIPGIREVAVSPFARLYRIEKP